MKRFGKVLLVLTVGGIYYAFLYAMFGNMISWIPEVLKLAFSSSFLYILLVLLPIIMIVVPLVLKHVGSTVMRSVLGKGRLFVLRGVFFLFYIPLVLNYYLFIGKTLMGPGFTIYQY